LAIAVFTSTDPNNRDVQRSPKPTGKSIWNVFQHQGKTTCLLQLLSFLKDSFLTLRILCLAAVSKSMHSLRRQPEVSHHRYSHANQPFDHADNLGFSTFDLHSGSAGMLQQAACCCNSLVFSTLVTKKRQVTNHQWLLRKRIVESPPYGLAVMKHLLHAHGQGGGMAKNNHGQRISDQNHISSSGFNERSAQGIPGG